MGYTFVNMKGIAGRIQEMSEKLNLKASSFASRIGVSPSILSHVLNGRNKASLGLILKIHSAFPEVDLGWLLTGESNPKIDSAPSIIPEKTHQVSENGDRIVILHSNGTYEEFVKG